MRERSAIRIYGLISTPAIAAFSSDRREADEQRPQTEPRQVVPPTRRHRADAAELNADRRKVGEAGQRERGQLDSDRSRHEDPADRSSTHFICR